MAGEGKIMFCKRTPLVAVLTLILLATACSGSVDEVADLQTPTGVIDEPDSLPVEEPVEVEVHQEITAEIDPWMRLSLLSAWTGDLDGMIERGFIRALVVHSPTFYFLDGARERGLAAESARALEEFMNKRLKEQGKRLRVVPIPVRRDQLLPFLVQGLGDIAGSNLTITDERRETVDFTQPHWTGVRELVVTGPHGPALNSPEDLAGMEIWVRGASSYHESLVRLNEVFRLSGRQEIEIRKADENLEDEDILEMVNAGLLPATVVDSHKLEFLWSRIFDDITVHHNVAIRTGGEIATAIRKESPRLREALNDFYDTHGIGTTFGNTIVNRYLKSTRWVRNAHTTVEMKKYAAVVDLFRKYGEEYDFDYLMLIAQGYQESWLDQNTRSSAGAVGIMQVLPSTANGPPIFIANIDKVDPNIRAGVKYLRFLVDEYFDEPEIDPVNRMLFAFASYNAGPNRIARIRRQAAERGINPDEWFREVEFLVEKKIGREPVRYVGNIYKYYLAYKRIRDRVREEQEARERLGVIE